MNDKANDHAAARARTQSTQPDEILPDDLLPLCRAARLVPSRRPGKSVHVNTIRRLVKRGQLRAWRFAGTRYVSQAEVMGLFHPEARSPKEAPRTGATRKQLDAWTLEVLRRHKLA
jgi:hypothetical protein